MLHSTSSTLQGGNLFYVFELLRAMQPIDQLSGERVIEDVISVRYWTG
jgi:hypothetical protein